MKKSCQMNGLAERVRIKRSNKGEGIMNEKLMSLFSDKEFADRTITCKSAEDVLAMIRAEGVDVTNEEFDSFMYNLARIDCKAEEELDENELSQVSGGAWWPIISGIVGAIWYLTYKEPYERGKAEARKRNNQRKNEIC